MSALGRCRWVTLLPLPVAGPWPAPADTRKAVQPQVNAVIAAVRSGKQLAVTSIGFKGR